MCADRTRGGWLLAILLLLPGLASADYLIFGSFRSAENASNWAQKLSNLFAEEISVAQYEDGGLTWYRVQSANKEVAELQPLRRKASSAGIQFWKKTAGVEALAERSVPPPLGAARLSPPSRTEQPRPRETVEAPVPAPDGEQRLTWDVGLQSRAFANEGLDGQDRLEGSISLELEYYKSWDRDRRSLTVTPFVRLDSNDSERSHADLREAFYSRIGDDWDLHIGARRVFWGVTEFHHLIDVINQTDLVENIDSEDKLGQPMVQLSLVRDWGILDFYLLPYFRERSFPGDDGRLGLPIPVFDDEPLYESGSEERHIDGAVRWSHYVGPLAFGLAHFSGTSRDPMFVPAVRGGRSGLVPYYPLIEQTALDAQAIAGDWAFKFEGFNRSGYGDTYHAFNVGLERTIVGAFGTRADLGVVLEYMYDERGDDAFNTLFEHDVALGARMQMNDLAGTQALLGLIYDTDNGDRVLTLEGSRRMGDSWALNVEGRVFGGGRSLPASFDPTELLSVDYKSAILQSEDYLQIELKKFF